MNADAAEAADAPLVDGHAHVWSAQTPLAQSAWKRPARAYPVEQFLADLDAHGVRFGVIAAASLFGTNNDYSLQALRAHPRLRATAMVDEDIAFDELRALRDAGFTGIRLQWFFLESLPDIEGARFQRLCAGVRELGMHLQLNIRGERLVDVAGRLARTGAPVVIDHFGWHDPAARLAAPSYVGMLRLLERPGVLVKITSGYRHPDEHFPDWSLPVEYAQDLLRRFGPAKLLWGSDAPFIGHEQVASYALALERFRQCVPDAAQRAAIGRNAHRFYFGS